VAAGKWPEYLKHFRDRHNLTQQQLADRLPTSVLRIEAFEQGESVPPQFLKRALRDLERDLSNPLQTLCSSPIH
jgi:transcriptional regulator with XRE-family HTH domain